ncbi:class I SAM-dependent methyltransferase [Chloroflexota bacterium]
MVFNRNEISEISECPACNNRIFQKQFTKKGKDFWRCTNCGLENQYPLPNQEELNKYYDESYSEGMYKTFTDANDMKLATARQRLKEIRKNCSPGRWLDVGCSNGIFVEIARNNGIDAEGIDVSNIAVSDAHKRGLPVFRSTIEEFNPGYQYNLITAFDVLEHVLDPISFMQSIFRLLVPQGMVALSLPDQGSIIRKIMGKRWYFYIPEEHMYYFNRSTISKLLNRTGFDNIQIKIAYKPLTYNYSLTQFEEYNPSIFTMFSLISKVIPREMRELVVPLYIGEMMVIAERQA